MDAVKFFQTVKRLCKNPGCEGCPVCKYGMCMVMRMARLDDASDESIEETISKVEQWAKENPVKTRQSELLKLFPNTKINSGAIVFCPINFLPEVEKNAYCEKHESCKECRKDYWLAEMTDND